MRRSPRTFRAGLAVPLATATALCLAGCRIAATAEAWDNERPSWTPDGDIVFASNRDGNWDLFLMTADGADQINLTRSAADELFPAVSPDGREIAFVRAVDDNYDIYVLERATGSTRRLTTHPAIDDWPSWADDGRSIVFDSERGGNWAVLIMNADGSGQRVLVDGPGRDIDPHTVPGSPWVVYSRDRDDERQIQAFHRERGDRLQLTRNEFANGHPALDPSASRVVYNAGTDYWQLFVVPLGGGEEFLIAGGEYDNRWGAWSPDGTRIAFASNRDGRWDIYRVDATGNGETRLTRGAAGLP